MAPALRPARLSLPASEAFLDDCRTGWPPRSSDDGRGYRPPDLHGSHPESVLDLGEGRALVAVRQADGSRSALPCRLDRGGWRVAVAGDGLAIALLRVSGATSETIEAARGSAFELVRLVPPWPVAAGERDLGTDQSNRSVVVDERRIVKWRSAASPGGLRGIRLRRHLATNGFAAVPQLEGYLLWRDASGAEHLMCDVDSFLPGAQDGWEHLIPALAAAVEEDRAADDAVALGASLGSLVAGLHVALGAASDVIPDPCREATRAELRGVREAALAALGEAVAIEAEGQVDVAARREGLEAAIKASPRDRSVFQPVHGDLHIGQLVFWRDGLALIDFDGPPAPMSPAGDMGATARDVAQLTVSLWNLAAAVEARIDGNHATTLRAWAARAEHEMLGSYRQAAARLGRPDLLDERLLVPFVAEQLCRELVYAERMLPRWRYAPLRAIGWRYPLST